jgi:hypothetical protein
MRFPTNIGRYALPDYTKSLDHLSRVLHRDLPSLSARGLDTERVRVEGALDAACGRRMCVFHPAPIGYMLVEDWLVERLQAIRAEIRRRQGVRP